MQVPGDWIKWSPMALTCETVGRCWLLRFSRIPVYEVRFDNIIGADISLAMVRYLEDHSCHSYSGAAELARRCEHEDAAEECRLFGGSGGFQCQESHRDHRHCHFCTSHLSQRLVMSGSGLRISRYLKCFGKS